MPPMSNRKQPTDLREAQPFHRSANAYHKMGWLPFPIPHKSKGKPPTGVTGAKDIPHARWAKKIDAWLKKHPKNSSVALKMPPGVLCIDVDAYKEKGLDTLTEIAEELGVELPDTWRQTSRFDGVSGHYLFRVPEGLKWPGAIGPGIETVHSTHRYLVAAPSLHEEAGSNPEVGRYLWYAPDEEMDGEGHIEPPRVEDLPELPGEWVEYLTSGRHAKLLPEKRFRTRAESDAAIGEWIASKGDAMCNTMAALVAEAEESMGPGAHDLTRDLVYRLGALAAEGHRGLGDALSRLYAAFAGEVERDDRGGGHARSAGEAGIEWGRFRDGAIKKLMAQEDELMFYGYPEECHCAEVGADGRPKRTVNLSTYDLYAEIPRTYAALAPDAAGYGAYMFGDKMVQLLPGRHVEIGVDYLRSLVAGSVGWQKNLNVDGASIPVPAVPPREFLLSVLADERRYEGLPALRGVVKTPFWAMVEGKATLVGRNGYHPDAKVFLDMDPEMTETVEGMDLEPNSRWVERAKTYLDEMLEGFPFDAPADKTNALAAFILPFVRELVDGPTPLHLFGAPTPGTGKGLLADCVSMIAVGPTGEGREMIPVGKDRGAAEELAKGLTASMLRMPTVLILDNVDGKLDSPQLASALTNHPYYEARILGGSTIARVPNRTTWIATANNLLGSRDIVRRIVPVRVDAKGPSPHLRKFRVDLREWVPANRPALVWSILTLVAHWVTKGSPLSDVRMGSFEGYAAVLGGILDAAGYPGFLSNRTDFEAEATEDGEDVIDLFEGWAEAIGLGRASAQQAIELLQPGVLPNIGNWVAIDQPNAHVTLGRLFAKYRGRPIGAYTLMKGMEKGRAKWYLIENAKPNHVVPTKKKRVKARG